MDDVPARVFEDLADTLWHERHTAERLLYRMTTAKLLLAADEHRFVSAAMDEVEHVVGSLRGAEARRLAALAEVSDRFSVPLDDLTLAELARRAPAAMRMVFEDHRRAFLELSAEIEETADANRQLASSGLRRVRRSLDALTRVAPDPAEDPVRQAWMAAPLHLERAL